MSRFPSLRLEDAILVPAGDQARLRVVARTHGEAPKAPTVRIHHVQVAAPGAFKREGQPAPDPCVVTPAATNPNTSTASSLLPSIPHPLLHAALRLIALGASPNAPTRRR